MRSPVMALAAIGCFLACQVLCPGARVMPRAPFAQDSVAGQQSSSDPCCGGTKQTPEKPTDDSGCCSSCCCSGAPMTQTIPLDYLTFVAVLPFECFDPTDCFRVTSSTVNPFVCLRPAEPSLETTILLI